MNYIAQNFKYIGEKADEVKSWETTHFQIHNTNLKIFILIQKTQIMTLSRINPTCYNEYLTFSYVLLFKMLCYSFFFL